MIESYFFNSVLAGGVHDRTYNSEDISTWLSGIVSSGVLANPSNNMQVMADSGLGILVKVGEGWINGHKIKITTDVELTIATADVTLPRIDRVVFALNKTDREMQVYVKTGTVASSPVAPSLSDTSTLIELCLANVYVGPGVTSITQSNITDTRMDNSLCGYVHALITQVDTTTLYNQYQAALTEFTTEEQAEFDSWFQNVKDTLTAVTLFREYKHVYTTTIANETTIAIPVTELHYNSVLDILHIWVNGFRLVEDVDYTKTSTTITFTNPIEVIGTSIEFSNWKSVDGSSAETIIEEVEELQEQVDYIYSQRYTTTGTNDNTAICDMVNSFFAGTGNYSQVNANAQLKLDIYGTIALTGSSTIIGTGDSSGLFAFTVPSGTNKKVILDFSYANIVLTSSTNVNAYSLINIDSDKIEVRGIKADLTMAGTSFTFRGINSKGDVKDCYMVANLSGSGTFKMYNSSTTATVLQNTFKDNFAKIVTAASSEYAVTGYFGVSKFINCNCDITNVSTTLSTIGFDTTNSIIDSCDNRLVSNNYSVFGFSFINGELNNCRASIVTGLVGSGYGGTGKVTNCYASVTSSSSNIYGSATGFNVNGELNNCEAITRNAGTGNSYGYSIRNSTGSLILNNCIADSIIASTSTATASGIYVSSVTTQQLVAIGCRVLVNTRSNFKNTNSILLAGTTAGCKYSLFGNILYQATTKHTGTGNTESGTIIA